MALLWKLRPMSRLEAMTVLAGLSCAWRLASEPTSRLPLSSMANTDGMVLSPPCR